MKLKNIEWRNIKSFGNKLQRLDFDKEGGLWMITGKNGYGKTTLLELPKILYYGKLENFKKDEIANRSNKHGWIKGEIEINPTTSIVIERNLSPSDLTVSKNGDNIGKAGITNYQSYIDLEVTGLPYHIFSNIISLSLDDFKSFMKMTPNDKRIIIDKLFAMEIINRMNDLVKRDLREIKINMTVFDREIISIKRNIDSAIKELDKLKKKTSEDNKERINEIARKLIEYKPKLEEGYKKQREFSNKKNDIEKSYNIFLEQKTRIKQDISQITNKINLFDQDKCSECETPFSEPRFDLIKEKLQEDIKRKKEEFQNILQNEQIYASTFSKLNGALAKINQFIIQVQSAYRTLESEYKRLKADKPEEFKSIQNIISKNTRNLSSKETDKVKFDDDFKYLAILEQLYSDTGVKKKILENYLPTLNSEIEFTLHELHFPYSLKFNSDFEPELHQLGEKIGVDTLSTGETKRVDLAVLISIIRMLKRKYPALNIFMLDEVLSSIDGDGIYDIIGLLQSISKEMNMNIFIINHSPLPIEHFSYKIEVTKKAGFSDIVIDDLEK